MATRVAPSAASQTLHHSHRHQPVQPVQPHDAAAANPNNTAAGKGANTGTNPGFSPRRSPSPAPQHRRGYQACDPCRKRKVRCDLGSVDNPRPPPCVRCRRESKRCEFSATRRKRKVPEAANGDAEEDTTLRRDKRMMSADASRLDSAESLNSGTNNNVNDNDNDDDTNSNDVSPFPPAPPSAIDTDISMSAASHRRWTEPGHPPINRFPISPANPIPSSQYHSNSNNVSASVGTSHRLPARSVGGPGAGPGSGGYAENLTGASGQQVMNRTAAELLSPAISNTHDALHLLSEAAGRTEDLNRQQQMDYRYAASSSTFASPNDPIARGSISEKSGRSMSNGQQSIHRYQPRTAGSTAAGVVEHRAGDGVVGASDTGGSGAGLMNAPPSLKGGFVEDVDYVNAVRVWSRFRFIRAGWFSVDEAMGYIAYYYEHLAPLSPIVIPNYSSPSMHLTLLTEEPVLTVTMLTIASRHMPLTGNGANSRAYSIHEKLWSYLRGMIERLFWGQEKFDGGTLPSQMPKFSFTPGQSNASNGHLRSLGTIEALLLLTDWHPRALHFPPGDDENTLLDIDPQLLTQIQTQSLDNKGNNDHDYDPIIMNKAQSTSGGGGGGGGGGSEGRLAFYKWLEPVWRSDRMSWMLLSTAQALAFELGVFDPKNDQVSNANTESSTERIRKRRVRKLILVYVSQSSGRLGIPSMLPLPQWGINMDPVSSEDCRFLDPNEDRSIDLMQDCWMDISKIMYTSNQVLFQSKEQTTNLIKSGRYREQIDKFIPSLKEFRMKFDRVSMSGHMRHILAIEYEYTRLYVNCLALQAVVDRWTTMGNEAQHLSATASTRRNSATGQTASSSAANTTASWRVLMEQYQVNEPYIQEVVDASRRILKTVLDGLVPGDSLKHAPVRTFFRILSGMIFILKTFTLGAKEDEVRISLDLQDRTVESLRTCVVDDVHLSVTIADLLQLLTSNIRNRFLRFAPPDRGTGECSSRERTPQLQSQPQALMSSPMSTRQSPHPPDHLNHTSQQLDQNQNDFQNPARWQQQHQQHQLSTNTPFHYDPNSHHHHQQTNHHSHSHSHSHSHPQSSSAPSTTHADPLANIPAQPLNSSNLTVSFMPPPASVYYNYYDPSTASLKIDLDGADPTTTATANASNTNDTNNNTISPDIINSHNHTGNNDGSASSLANGTTTASGANGPSSTNNTNNNNTSGAGPGAQSDWFALPLDQFFNSSTMGVDQGLGGTGPMVGEFDMLEVLLKEQDDMGGGFM
ncbi:C6 transcription factor [Blastomyces dermatitidis ER-3]|uniref:C6 transcription factor n=1 Tax=Ajellomyces dermatitidis (strain ER-3 / ATCC MYA-2586) TaxID=559297 RepID=A0ABP2F443_AJEDR|nr:C6 transcription factor [Blastomyces dermatitidis ER-3]EEQ89924.2 C6 transcription factor [Blastomyces dermatitidis ER-3]